MQFVKGTIRKRLILYEGSAVKHVSEFCNGLTW